MKQGIVAVVAWVTCYFRHLKTVFEKAGIEVTNVNKQDVDRIIHEIVGVKYKSCPDTWREVKKRLADNEEGFASKLKEEWKKHRQKSSLKQKRIEMLG